MTRPAEPRTYAMAPIRPGETVTVQLTIVVDPVPGDGDAESNPFPGYTIPEPSTDAGAGVIRGGGVTQTVTAGSQGVGRTPAGVRWDRIEQALTDLGLRAPSHVGRAPVLELEGYERLLNLAREGAIAAGLL